LESNRPGTLNLIVLKNNHRRKDLSYRGPMGSS